MNALLDTEYGEDNKCRTFDDHFDYETIDQRNDGEGQEEFDENEEPPEELKKYQDGHVAVVVVLQIGVPVLVQILVVEPELLRYYLVDVDPTPEESKEDLVYDWHSRVDQSREIHLIHAQEETVIRKHVVERQKDGQLIDSVLLEDCPVLKLGHVPVYRYPTFNEIEGAWLLHQLIDSRDISPHLHPGFIRKYFTHENVLTLRDLIFVLFCVVFGFEDYHIQEEVLAQPNVLCFKKLRVLFDYFFHFGVLLLKMFQPFDLLLRQQVPMQQFDEPFAANVLPNIVFAQRLHQLQVIRNLHTCIKYEITVFFIVF